VAIVVENGEGVVVYDVDTGRERALSASSVEKFYLESKRIKAIYLSKFLTEEEKNCIKSQVERLLKKNPSYDYTFSSGEDKLYCLEFVQVVLRNCRILKKLKPLVKSLRGKELPLDYFRTISFQ